ncbi:hypothetical protein Esti_003421 [Eimeria stiedai]
MAAAKPPRKKKGLHKAQGVLGPSYDSAERGAPEAPASSAEAAAPPSPASAAKSELKKTTPKRKREAAGEGFGEPLKHVHASREAHHVSEKKQIKEFLGHKKEGTKVQRSQRADDGDPATADCSTDESCPTASLQKAEVIPAVASEHTETSKEAKMASATAADARRWSEGRRWVVLLSYCPLLLVRPRGSSKKERRKQQASCLLTADDHSQLIESVVTVGPTGDISSSSSKKGVNPMMPVVRRVQAHLSAVSSAVSASQRNNCTKGSLHGSRVEGPIGTRVRECITSEAARVAAAAADPNWVAAACMRPDVVHQCLLSFLDSPLVKMLRQQQRQQENQPLDLLLHTLDGKLLRVSLNFRVPRTFRVFKKVIEKALSSPTGKLEAALEEGDDCPTQSQPLIEVLQPPFSRYFEEDACWVALSESRKAPPVSLRSFINGLPRSLAAEAKVAAGRKGSSKSPEKPGTLGRLENHQQKHGSDVVPPVVFVLSSVSSIDSAVVPQWQQHTPEPSETPEETAEADGHHEVDREGKGNSVHQAQAARLLAVAPYSYPMPASLRLDRLLHELTRAATKHPNF